ncbi:biotin carboxyl carrier protein [Luteibacter sp. HA06]
MKTTLQSLLRLGITATVVCLALLLGRLLWNHYMISPWTRDARMRAEVVRIAPDVSGLVTRVAVVDNQDVKKGDVLFEIDPSRFRFALQQAEANLAAAKASAHAAGANIDAVQASADARKTEYEMRQEQATRRQALLDLIPKEERNNARSVADSAMAAWHEAQATGHQAGAAREQALAAVALAQVTVDQSRLDLERTEVRAPVDGYVTNLVVRTARLRSHGKPVRGADRPTQLLRLRVFRRDPPARPPRGRPCRHPTDERRRSFRRAHHRLCAGHHRPRQPDGQRPACRRQSHVYLGAPGATGARAHCHRRGDGTGERDTGGWDDS